MAFFKNKIISDKVFELNIVNGTRFVDLLVKDKTEHTDPDEQLEHEIFKVVWPLLVKKYGLTTIETRRLD
jgi:hypothetical protein